MPLPPGDDRPSRTATSRLPSAQAAGERAEQLGVDRDGDGDPADHAAAVDDRDAPRAAAEVGAGDAGEDPADAPAVAAPERPLQRGVGGKLLGRAGGGVEAGAVGRDGAAQPRLQPGVHPAGLAPLGERVVAVERHGKREQRQQREPENQFELEAPHRG